MAHDMSTEWAGGVREVGTVSRSGRIVRGRLQEARQRLSSRRPVLIDTTQPDPRAAAECYRRLLGWELTDTMPPNSTGQYFVAR
jgi:hypothetical protein